MLAGQRQMLILAEVRRRGAVRVSELTELLNVSDMTAERMAQAPDRIKDYLSLVFIARHLERVGDHAKNIGEDAVFAAVAEEMRHTRSRS